MSSLGSVYWDNKFLKHLDVDKLKCIFEIGARYGDESLKLADIFKNAELFSFEINPLTVDECRDKLSDHDRIKFFDLGLGDKNEVLPFYSFMNNNDGASSLLKRRDFNLTQKETGFTTLQRLDDFAQLNNVGHINLLCMDVQGFELNILRGAGKLLKNIDFVIMEQPKQGIASPYIGCPPHEEIFEFMTSNNFVEIERIRENDLEDNVMYKNRLNFI